MEKEQRNIEETLEQKKKQLPGIFMQDIQIRNLIYVIRGRQVMMDSDLADLYQVETKVFNQAVKRNIARFPEAFRFQLTYEEYTCLRSQIVTSNGRGGRRYLPYVFTEQGIAMLSAVLNSDTAIQVSIHIMTAFAEMRKLLSNDALLFDKISEVDWRQQQYEKRTDEHFEKVFAYIAEHEESKQRVFYDGQIYDAFSFLVDLVESADASIVLIDNYIDVDTLNILSKKKLNVVVFIYTMRRTKLTEKDVANFNKQYPTLKVRYTEAFHDRFLILDKTRSYHIGASLKDAGKRCFAVSRLEDVGMTKDILRRLEQGKNC